MVLFPGLQWNSYASSAAFTLHVPVQVKYWAVFFVVFFFQFAWNKAIQDKRGQRYIREGHITM